MVEMEKETKPNGTQFEGKDEYVRDVFEEIAPYYDEMNDSMSLNMIGGWQSYLLDMLGDLDGCRCADIGTGTGEIAFMLAERAGKNGYVTGVDATSSMLRVAEEKMAKLDLPTKVDFRTGDAMRLDLEDCSFDAVTSGYMLRNISDIQSALNEMYRILKPGGRVAVTEMATPDNRAVRWGYELYMKYRVRRMGRRRDGGKAVGGKMPAYDWLSESIEGFPHGEDMAEKFRRAGFADVAFESKNWGTVYFYTGVKK